MVAIVLSGSRYVFVSMVVLAVIACFQFAAGRHEVLKWRPNLRKMVVTLGFAAAGIAILVAYLPYNRIDELVGSGVARMTRPSKTSERSRGVSEYTRTCSSTWKKGRAGIVFWFRNQQRRCFDVESRS